MIFPASVIPGAPHTFSVLLQIAVILRMSLLPEDLARMKPRYQAYNPKRRILPPDSDKTSPLRELATKVTYGGNPEHKQNPGDFGLTPPSGPRSGKSLCDSAQVFSRSMALSLLQVGIKKGLISDRAQNGWPKNIWAVSATGMPLEAQLENPDVGSYHAYPMPTNDPLATEVVTRWNNA